MSVAPNFKIRVTNNSGAIASVRLTSAQTPVINPLPRSLTDGGNLKVSVSAAWQSEDRVTGSYSCTNFRTLGDTNATQNIFTIQNPAVSTVNLSIRGLFLETDSTAVLTSVAPSMKLSRPAVLPTGGTVLTATKFNTTDATAVAICRGATASDGGVATAITATASTVIWSKFIDRLHTAVGWVVHPGYNMVPDVGADLRQIILVPGESLLVQSVLAIAATTHVNVNCSWIEYRAL